MNWNAMEKVRMLSPTLKIDQIKHIKDVQRVKSINYAAHDFRV